LFSYFKEFFQFRRNCLHEINRARKLIFIVFVKLKDMEMQKNRELLNAESIYKVSDYLKNINSSKYKDLNVNFLLKFKY